MVLLLPGEPGGQHLAVLAGDDRADGEGGLGRRAEPGQLDRRAQEPVIRAAGAEQVAQQDHLLDPARFGQGHGSGGAVGPGGAGGGGIGWGEVEARGHGVGDEEGGDGKVEFVGQVSRQHVAQYAGAAFDEKTHHGSFGQIFEDEAEGQRVTGIDEHGRLPQIPQPGAGQRRGGAVDQAKSAGGERVSPAPGEVLAAFPVQSRREVDAVVAAAREAAVWWAGLGPSGRRVRLLAWKSHLTRYMGRLAQLVHEETGKPLDDAKLEIILAILHIDWAARHARRVLRPRRVRSGIAAINQAATVEYLPLGVVGVIGPWNYPVFTPVGSIAYALAAGNAVVFKPSELTPATGDWLVRSFGEALGIFSEAASPVLQLITGAGSTGEALARSGVGIGRAHV